MASSSHVQKKLKTLHEFFVKSLEKADFPNAQTILKAAAEKHPMLSSMLLEADKIEIIDVLLKESYAQAISQAKVTQKLFFFAFLFSSRLLCLFRTK